ncbi:MAG: YrdB family protein [Myxococcaceae bacterium]
MASSGMPGGINFNDVVAFFVELAALVTLCAWGFQTGTGMLRKVLLGLGTPALAIALWALFAAPRAVYQGPLARLGVKLLVLGGGVLASFTLVPTAWAVAFAVVVAANLLLMYVGPFAR